MVGRFAAITGPATWALVLYITVRLLGMPPLQGQAVGVVTLLLQVILAYAILQRVSDARREWTGADAVA